MAVKLNLKDMNGRTLVFEFINGDKGGVFSNNQMPALWAKILMADNLYNHKKRADLHKKQVS